MTLSLFKNYSLTIVLAMIFVICISLQTFVGWRLQNEILAARGRLTIGYWDSI